jgi:hypothetical protein
MRVWQFATMATTRNLANRQNVSSGFKPILSMIVSYHKSISSYLKQNLVLLLSLGRFRIYLASFRMNQPMYQTSPLTPAPPERFIKLESQFGSFQSINCFDLVITTAESQFGSFQSINCFDLVITTAPEHAPEPYCSWWNTFS